MIVIDPAEIKRRRGTTARWRARTSFASSNRVKVVLTPQGRELVVERAKRVVDLLEHLDITPGTVLVIRGNQLLTEDARLSPHDELELRSVVSGG